MLLDARGNPIYTEIATIGGGRDVTRPYLDDSRALDPLDELLANRETTIRGYKTILRDPQVKSTFQQRRLAVVSRDWEVRPGGTKRQDRRAAEWLQEQLQHIGWDRVAEKMLFGVFFGYAVGELLYARDGQTVGLDGIRVRDRERFGFGQDFGLRLFTMNDQVRGEEMPDQKFWVFSTGADHDDDPYGLGLAHFLYWPVFFKKHGKAHWLKNLERWAQPVPHGKYPPGTPLHEQQKLLGALHSLQHDAGIITPDGMEVGLLEASRAGTADYNELQVDENAAISKVVLSQTMTTDAQSAGLGSSQADVHQDVAESVQRSDADLLVSSFCSSARYAPLKWLMDWNFPGAAMPEIHYEFDEPEDLNAAAERDQRLHAAGWTRTAQNQEETYGEGWERSTGEDESSRLGTEAEEAAPGQVEREVRFAERDDPAQTPERFAERLLDEQGVDDLMRPVEEMLASASTLEEFRQGLDLVFAEMDPESFGRAMQRALLTAELAGMYEVDREEV
ncbi:MAG: DUF935 family protein [Bacteroidota bacterium]